MSLPHIVELMIAFARSDGLNGGDISLIIYNEVDFIEESIPVVLVYHKDRDYNTTLLYKCKALEVIVESGINKRVNIRQYSRNDDLDIDMYTRPVTIVSCTSIFNSRHSAVVSTYYDMK